MLAKRPCDSKRVQILHTSQSLNLHLSVETPELYKQFTPTRVDLLEGAAEPDVVQTAIALWRARADVGELGGWYQGAELLLPQKIQLRALRTTAKVSQQQQLLVSCTQMF